MNRFPSKSLPDIRKSAIQNRKWVGLFAIVVAFALCGARADAQQSEKVFRIGFLDASTASGMAVLIDAFREELSKLGWHEGKNFTIEYRFAEGRNDRLPELAADLVRLKVDLIVVTGGSVPLVAEKATTTIPIVMASGGDPEGRGLVTSLARPGGNITGVSSLNPELNTKRLEILKDAIPRLSHVGFLRSPVNTLQVKELRAAAPSLKLKLEEIETQPDSKGLEAAFQIANQKQVGAIMTITTRRFLPKESASSSWPVNTGCLLFTFRRSSSMRAVSCPMGRTSMTCSCARLVMWTRY